MKKIVCTCCGHEMTEDDRLCPECGENNEYYVEPVIVTKPQNTQGYVNKPINKVEIYQTSNSQSNSQPTYVYSQTTVQVTTQTEGCALAVWALVLSILGGLAPGLILAIIGLNKYKSPTNRGICTASIIIFIAWFIIGFIIGLTSYS